MQDVLKEKGGKGNHFEIPPANFLSDVDCAKKRRLAFLRNAREEMKSGSKYEKWCSSEFRLFNTPASKKCHQEKENVSCQTWNLSKILHTQIFRLKVLHRKSA